eukprot:scaffold72784_cov51-Phaeocystis_antarctica.AAC.3
MEQGRVDRWTFVRSTSCLAGFGRNVSGRSVSGRNVSGRNVSGRNVSGSGGRNVAITGGCVHPHRRP